MKFKHRKLSTKLGEITAIIVSVLITASALIMLLALLKFCILFLIG